ncbi:MAG: hypothetical protein PHV49_00535 [Alistipes sp.]|nr:hypothetical protein [Alistipes sp.]
MFRIYKIGLWGIALSGWLGLGAQSAPQDTVLASPQHPVIEATFSADTVLIGDQFSLKVKFSQDRMEHIEFPTFAQGHLGDSSLIEILKEGKVDTLAVEGRKITLEKSYTLTCFDEAHYHLGRFPVLYIDKNIVDTLWSQEPLQIVVNTLPVDTVKQKIFDVKAPLAAPVRFGEFSGYLGMTLGGAALLALLIWVIVRRLRNRPILGSKTVSDEPAHVEAIHRLEHLHNQKLWQSGKHKLYYTGLTDILRGYLARRYPLKAMEMTSQEILTALRSESIPEKSLSRLQEVLVTADFVKFAKYTPENDQNETAYEDAFYFVEETKPSEVETPVIQIEPIQPNDPNEKKEAQS